MSVFTPVNRATRFRRVVKHSPTRPKYGVGLSASGKTGKRAPSRANGARAPVLQEALQQQRGWDRERERKIHPGKLSTASSPGATSEPGWTGQEWNDQF